MASDIKPALLTAEAAEAHSRNLRAHIAPYGVNEQTLPALVVCYALDAHATALRVGAASPWTLPDDLSEMAVVAFTSGATGSRDDFPGDCEVVLQAIEAHVTDVTATLRAQLEAGATGTAEHWRNVAAEWEAKAVAEAQRANRAARNEEALRAEMSAAFRKHGLAAGPLAVDALAERATLAEERIDALAWWMEQSTGHRLERTSFLGTVVASEWNNPTVTAHGPLPAVLDALVALRKRREGTNA